MSMRLAGTLLAADPRLKILSTLILGYLAWRTGLVGLLVYLAVLASLCVTLFRGDPSWRRILRSCLVFILFWMALKYLLTSVFGPAPWGLALQQSLMLGGRITVVLLAGLCLSRSTSPRQLGLAMTSITRPILGNRSWRMALSLALMIHFLPLALTSLQQAAFSIRKRCPSLSSRRRIVLLTTASLREMSQKTWSQTVALATRGLDTPASWDVRLGVRPAHWSAGLLLLAAAAGLARI